jgi:hypothetical protein
MQRNATARHGRRCTATVFEKGDKIMNEWINLHLEYTSDPDSECPYIACLALPHSGDMIITDSGKRYRVVSLTFDSQASGTAEPCRIIASVEPLDHK